MQEILPDAPAPGQSIGPPFVTLVGIDGLGVPDCERSIPEVRPDPTPADSWSRWTDCIIVADGPGSGIGELHNALDYLMEMAMDYAEHLEGPDPDPDGIPPLEPSNDPRFPSWYHPPYGTSWAGPTPEGYYDDDDAVPEPLGSDAPDDRPSRSAHFAELLARGIVPPVSGGSDEAAPFAPSDEDWADYRQWSEDLDRRRAAADRHSPDALTRINLALYGTVEPAHA
jgi:hypothetical protein